MISFKDSVNDIGFTFNFDLDHKRCVVEANGTSLVCHLCVSEKEEKVSFAQSGCKPLSVFFESRFNAVGKIPGGFRKKDAQSDFDIILSRLIDRSLRPMISLDCNKDIRLYVQVLNYSNYSLEVLSVLASSLLLLLFGVIELPVSLGKISGNELNAANKKDGKFRFLAAFAGGINSSNLMVDYECLDGALFRSVDLYREILDKSFKITASIAEDLNNMQLRLLGEVKKISGVRDKIFPKRSLGFFANRSAWKYAGLFLSEVKGMAKTKKTLSSIINSFNDGADDYVFHSFVRRYISESLLSQVFKTRKRLDNRAFASLHSNSLVGDLRESSVVFDFVKSSCGINIVNRGNTQVCSSLCVADSNNVQINDWIDGRGKENLIVNYNFGAHLNDSVKKNAGGSRREIGHSDLIRKSLKALFSKGGDVARVVCDVFSSDGGSSMAAVCGASLLLYRKRLISELVCGISIGLIKKDGKREFLLDLTHVEDEFLSLVDCKIASSKSCITAMQLDSKGLEFKYADFNEMLSLGVVKLNQVLDFTSGLLKRSVVDSGFDPSVADKIDSVVLDVDTKSLKECLVRRDMQLSWLSKKLKVDFKFEGDNCLRLSSLDPEKLIDAEKFIRHLVKN